MTSSVFSIIGKRNSKEVMLKSKKVPDIITEIIAIFLKSLLSTLGGRKYKKAIPEKAKRLLIPLKKVGIIPYPNTGSRPCGVKF